MTEVKAVKAWVSTESTPRVTEVSGLVMLGAGWTAPVDRSGGTVLFRISSLDPSQPALTWVRSISPRSDSEPEVLVWAVDGDEFVSPAFGHGYEFRIEVSTAEASSSDGPTTVPVGGGHFRVVEEAGG